MPSTVNKRTARSGALTIDNTTVLRLSAALAVVVVVIVVVVVVSGSIFDSFVHAPNDSRFVVPILRIEWTTVRYTQMDGKENTQSCSPGSSRESASSYSSCSSPEVDVVAFTPRPPESTSDDDQKRYFCQRCLNHKQQHPRKGHKPFCQYANCECTDCRMVEERRRLNNMLSRRRLEADCGDTKGVGKKVRDPKCALCSAHGDKQPLRGHKKAQCPFLKCGCHLCGLVENRRTLMARQIKLRRDQQKQRKAQLLANASNTQTSQTHNTNKDGDFTQSERKAITEPLRVPPLMPVTMKPECNTPFAPLLLQPSTILSPSALLIPSMEALDVHLMQFGNYHPLMTPYSFHFTPIFPYTTNLPFLSTP